MKYFSVLVDEYYLKFLMKYKGMFRFKKLVEMFRQNEVKVVKYWKECLKRKVLIQWKDNVKEIQL